MKKITKATFKSFVKKNEGKLFINQTSSFDGMTDMVEPIKDGFSPAKKKDEYPEHCLGYHGIYLVNNSRDYFTHFENATYIGIEYYNCCGSGIVAIKK